MVNNIHQVTKTLDSFLAGDNLPQAYLFIGTSGAREVAENFAAKVLSDKFPSIDSIQFDCSKQGSIEAIREVLQVASLMPFKSKRKVVVMDNMDLASVQMMNALLKTLEEPPRHVVFILISSRALIPTVMSRCQVFSLSGQSSEAEMPHELVEAFKLLEQNHSAGTAERISLVSKLATLDDALLVQVIDAWLNSQVARLGDSPKNFPAVRNTIETLQALKGNFNKKMVLQNFVLTGLA